jgi:hypothetical protein
MLALIALVAVGAWTQRDELPAMRDWIADVFGRDSAVEPSGRASEELARRAEQKLESLLNGSASSTVAFDGSEVQSYVDYRLAPQLPPGVTDPVVMITDSTLALRVRIRLEELQETMSVEALRQILGDSTTIEAEVDPEITSPGVGQVQVLSLRAGAFPIPPLAIPMVLREAGLSTDGGMSRAVTFRVQPNVTSIAVRNGSLEVTTGPSGE